MNQTEDQKRRAERFEKGKEIIGKLELSKHEFPDSAVLKLNWPIGETTKFFISKESFLILVDKLKLENSAHCICFGGGYMYDGRIALTRKEDKVTVEISARGINSASRYSLPFFEVKYQDFQGIEGVLRKKMIAMRDERKDIDNGK